ncbi:MAG: hypothetical protein V3V35_05010 [Dehalococcoidia bacterium]
MSRAVLALELLSPDLRQSQIVAVTRDAQAMEVFRAAVLRHYQDLVASAITEEARLLALMDLHEVRARLALALGHAEGKEDLVGPGVWAGGQPLELNVRIAYSP